MDDPGVYPRRALEAHRSGAMFIHNVDRPWIGYSTGVDVGKPGVASCDGSLGEYLSRVVDVVGRLGQEWTHRITIHGLGRGAPHPGSVADERHEAVERFIHEISKLGVEVTLSLGVEDQSSHIAECLAEKLERAARRGQMTTTVLYHLAGNTVLGEEPHRRYVSHSFMYGNVEFAGNLTGLGGRAPSGYVLGDPPGGGRLGVVTLNLARLGYEAVNEDDFYDRLGALLETAVDALYAGRVAVVESLEAGLLPATRSVHASLDGHRSTVTLAGMNEALINLINAGVAHVAGKAVAYKVLEFIRKRLEEESRERHHNFSLESYPCMEAGAILAERDRQMYSDTYAQGEGAPYYTAASELPPGHGDDLWRAVDHQKRLHGIYGGGTMFEVHLRTGATYREECGLLVERIMGQGFGELKISPLFSLCPEHGYVRGGSPTCPICGREANACSWVDGRCRPLSGLSEGMKEAHRQRVSHDVKSG